jgi:hypothetical protein
VKTELYCVVRFTAMGKFSALYKVGYTELVTDVKPSKVQRISLLKGLITIFFEDKTKLVFGYDPLRVDLFYRPIKETEK